MVVPAITGLGLFAAFSDQPEVTGVLAVVLMIVIAVVLILALPGIIGGIGLLKGKEWGRTVTIIANALTVLNFPLGLALAIYTWWVLITRREELQFA